MEKLKKTEVYSCRACGGDCSGSFFSIDSLPVDVGFLPRDRQEAVAVARGRIQLVYCERCTHVFNACFDPKLVNYRPGYEVGLEFSSVFSHYMLSLVEQLVDRFDLYNKSILEIGCGRGWFLQQLCERGGNRGLGLDPTLPEDRDVELAQGTVRLIARAFGQECQGMVEAAAPDFICCLSVFEHISQPLAFMQMLKHCLGGKTAGLYWEVFNAERALRDGEVWSVLYEQSNYYTQRSLSSVLQRAGFEILEEGTCYEGGQYLYVHASNSGDSVSLDQRESEAEWIATSSGGHGNSVSLCTESKAVKRHGWETITPTRIPAELRAFAERYRDRFEWWSHELQKFRQQGKKVVFWGSGGKGVSFLNLLETSDLISHVVEINPHKQGCLIPGSGQEIIAPEALPVLRPDVVIISNGLYRQEIETQLRELGMDCMLYVA